MIITTTEIQIRVVLKNNNINKTFHQGIKRLYTLDNFVSQFSTSVVIK